MSKEATPKQDQIKALREANYERMMQKSRAQAAVEREDKKRELREKIRVVEATPPKQKAVKKPRPRRRKIT
jgi:hypothetical protein